MSTYHEEEFNLILNTKKYLINISILENQLSLVLTLLIYPPQQYSGFFSLEDLRICGKIFQHTNSLFEAKEIIKRTIIKKQLLINEDSHRAKITFDPGLDLDSIPFFMTLFRDLNTNNLSLSQTVENFNKSHIFNSLNYTPKTEPLINLNDSSNYYDYFNNNFATPSIKNIINDEIINYNIKNNYMIHNNDINRNKFLTFLPKFRLEKNNLIFNNRRTRTQLPKKIKRYSSYSIKNNNLFQNKNLNYLNYSMNNDISYTNTNNNEDTNSNLNNKENLYSHFFDSDNNVFKNNINRLNDNISFNSNDIINNRFHNFTQNSYLDESQNSIYNTISQNKPKRNDIINNFIYKRHSKTSDNNNNNYLFNQRNNLSLNNNMNNKINKENNHSLLKKKYSKMKKKIKNIIQESQK